MKFVKIRCPYNEYLMSEIIIPVASSPLQVPLRGSSASGKPRREAAIGDSGPIFVLEARRESNDDDHRSVIRTAPKRAKAISSAMSKALMLARSPRATERATSPAPISQRSSLSGHHQCMLGRLQWSIGLGSNWIVASPRGRR